MDAQTIYAFGGLSAASIAGLSAVFGKGRGGRSWAVAWLSLLAAGVSRTFVEFSPILVPLYTLLGSMFSLLVLHGSWRFSQGTRPLPRAVTAALLLVVPLRIVLHPALSDLQNRALGSVLCTVCVILSCAVLLRPRSGTPSASARALAFALPTVAAVSWIDGMGPLLGLPPITGIALWFGEGIAIAAIKISAFISLQKEDVATVHEELASHYREITEKSTDLFAEIDEEGVILYANPSHQTVLGVDPASVIGKLNTSIPISLISGEVDVEAGESGPAIYLAHHREDGRPITLECFFYRVRTLSGKYQTVITSRDISARTAEAKSREEVNARLEALVDSRTEELQSSLEQLQASNRLASLGTMAAGIAHQINNPIGSIQMGAEYALTTPSRDSEREKYWRHALENAVEQAKRCGRIVASMLQFARNEPTEKSDVDLTGILRHACDMTEPYARTRKATIETVGFESPRPIYGSAIELEQAMLNIIRNACEASDEPLTIVVSVTNSDNQVIVCVRDNGRGIPEKEIDQVLDPFYTTRLDAGGTGLGLSVAHGVIVDHEGTLTIESSVNEGTTIEVVLPLKRLEIG